MAAPDYVVVGHITRDIVEGASGGPEPRCAVGGTVTYAGLTARRLGCAVGVLTSAGPDLDVPAQLPGIEVVVVPARATTTFENQYDARGHRRQYLRAVASPLGAEHVPPGWRGARIVHLAPLAGELGPELLDVFAPGGIRAVTPQGWLRAWDASGLVSRPGRREMSAIAGALARFDVAVLSEEDVEDDPEVLRAYAAAAGSLVVTRGERGATVYRRGQEASYRAYPASVVDPTGAGDVFAAAYLVRLEQTGDPAEAADFANCAASFAIEGAGTSRLADLGQVLARRHGPCYDGPRGDHGGDRRPDWGG